MECYFGSVALPEENSLGKTAVVLFNIPELGICFKAPFDGVDTDHCDLASLLALLEFIDSNQQYLSKQTYQIYGNNRRVINQVNQLETPPAMFSELLERTRVYREKYRYSLDWVPTRDNSAFDGVLD